MKILFLGGNTAGLIGLLTLLSKDHRPTVKAYSNGVLQLAIAFGLDVTLGDAWKNKPWDLIVSVHGRDIVPNYTLDSATHGGINLHPCLWKYKGKDPIRRAIDAGESKFSVGAHRMTEKVDEGEVLVEKFIEIPLLYDFLTEVVVYSFLYPLYSIVLSEALEKICPA